MNTRKSCYTFPMNDTPKLALPLPMEALAEFCRKWNIIKLSVFGSILREDFRPDSDVDFLVVFAPGTCYGMFKSMEMESELQQILNRPVDLAEEESIQRSENWIRREEILSTAECLYRAA